MKSRFLYMKLLGLLLVIVGFSYSITSFYNFFECIFNGKIYYETSNIYIMSIGLLIPLYIFIYGVYFYFYTDFNITKVNKFILISNISTLIISIFMMISRLNFIHLNYLMITQVFDFIHFTLDYCLLLLSILGIYGCYKFKF